MEIIKQINPFIKITFIAALTLYGTGIYVDYLKLISFGKVNR